MAGADEQTRKQRPTLESGPAGDRGHRAPETRRSRPPGVSPTLQSLLRERLDRQRWSYGDVARRGGVPRSTVHHLATVERLVRMPQPATLDGLARGLELPLDVVRRAAAESCGIHVYEAAPDPEVDVLIASLQQLSADDRRHVAALVDSLLAQGRRAEEE